MKKFFWKQLAKLLARPRVTNWLVQRAYKTPYMHILSPDCQQVYMERYWLLNPYDRKTQKARWSWLPFSIRLHHIHRADYDLHMHDHPWDARTIILQGWYEEKRPNPIYETKPGAYAHFDDEPAMIWFNRTPGDTAALKHGEYHQIAKVSNHGAVTVFITFKYQGMWGFLVNGVKVPWKKYLGLEEHQDLPDMGKKP
ncbi:hypothetical protein GOD54_23535 [Sinorhizobium medicae]|nr:hypothetical protein [Sinorhizobium medicae]